MLVSVAGMVVVIDEDLIQTQTVECLTIYGTCENKLLYSIRLQSFYVVHSTDGTTYQQQEMDRQGAKQRLGGLKGLKQTHHQR